MALSLAPSAGQSPRAYARQGGEGRGGERGEREKGRRREKGEEDISLIRPRISPPVISFLINSLCNLKQDLTFALLHITLLLQPRGTSFKARDKDKSHATNLQRIETHINIINSLNRGR